jgi:hypothetical protein
MRTASLLVAVVLALPACAPTRTLPSFEQAAVVNGIKSRGGTLKVHLTSAYQFPDPSTFGTKGAVWEGVMYIEPRYPEVEGMLAHLYGHLFGGPQGTCVDSEEIPTRWQAEALAFQGIDTPARFHARRCLPWGTSPDAPAEFAVDWVKALLGLQLVVDRDAKKQFLAGMRDEYFPCEVQMLGCHDAVIASYADSSNPDIRKLVGILRGAIREVSALSAENRKVFASTDWEKGANGANCWQSAKHDPQKQSEQLAAATKQVLLPLLRADRAASYDPGALAITREQRDELHHFQSRACDHALLGGYGLDDSRPMSAEVCRLLAWLDGATQFRPL